MFVIAYPEPINHSVITIIGALYKPICGFRFSGQVIFVSHHKAIVIAYLNDCVLI